LIRHRDESWQVGEGQLLGIVEVDDLKTDPPKWDSSDVEGRCLGIVVSIESEPPVIGRGFICGNRNRPERNILAQIGSYCEPVSELGADGIRRAL
jgi:hypothetical protein